MNKRLTESEIQKWRRILVGKFGPYAFVMTNEQIQVVYEKMHSQPNRDLNQSILGRRSLGDISKSSDM